MLLTKTRRIYVNLIKYYAVMLVNNYGQNKSVQNNWIDIVMKEILADEKSGNYTWLVPAKTDPYLIDK